MINIPSYIDDASYRYKMPKMFTKIEGRGNGIRTNIVNLPEICKALRIPTQYALKFLGFELGSQTIYKEQGNEIQCIIQGAQKAEMMPKKLDNFIEKYILCPKCKYPETSISVKKKLIYSKCNACGAEELLDNKHKLTQFIVKNPPINVSEFKKEKQEKQETKRQVLTKEQILEILDKKKLRYQAEDLYLNSIRLDKMSRKVAEYYDDELKKNSNPTFENNSEAVELLYKKVLKCRIHETLVDRLIFVIFNSMFNVNIAKQINLNTYLLQQLIQKFEQDEEKIQIHILLNLQYFLLEKHNDTDFIKYIATLLKIFYDNEIFSKEFLINWHNNQYNEIMKKIDFLFKDESNQLFMEHSQDFIDWLSEDQEEGEEEDDEDGEEEDDDEKDDEQANDDDFNDI